MSEMSEKNDQRHRLISMAVMIFAAVGGVLYGYDLGVFAGAFLFLQKDIAMSVQQMSFLVGSVLFGGSFAILISGPLADWLGRRYLIMISSAIFLVGVVIIIMSHSFAGILTGRVTQGIGVGIITIVVPLYLSESVPADLRGRGVCIFQLLLTAGILLAGLVDDLFVRSGSWRAMFAMSAIPGIVMLFGCIFLRESPRWLVMKNKDQLALAVLQKTRAPAEATKELAAMQKLRSMKLGKHARGHQESIWQKRFIVPFLIVLGVASLNQLIAVNSILQLGPMILKGVGLVSDAAAIFGFTGIFAINFIVTLLVIGFVDKIERRVFYRIGTAGLALALIFCGCIAHANGLPGIERGYLILAGLLAFMLFYAMGPGLLVWVILAELLPLRIRSSGMAIALFANSMISAVWASLFLDAADRFGYDGVFWICGGFGVLYFLLVFLGLPKVKGKSLEMIETEFSK